jgi:hypothetical protein
MGYGRPLVTGLDKLYRSSDDRAYLTPILNTLLNLINALLFILAVVLVPGAVIGFTVVTVLLGGSPLDLTYDPPKQRFKKIKQQLNDALKDKSLSVERKQIFLNDFTVINNILNELEENLSIYEGLWSIVFPWGRKQRSLIEVQQELENLYNNDLFAAGNMLTANG